MKIGNSAENTLITSTPDTPRKQFKIQATGKAFSILSNALYQHKVKAVVREIGCNAWDAHIDASNTQTPFNVSLPSKSDPHFKVRDFGIGLAEDKFVDVYTTYFGSSKSDSNDHTGGLGLGSKTPFIMSKTFTVHSYYEGTEYMWHSYVNDNGEPDVVLLTKKDTTEPNGLLVIVPIGQGMSDTEQHALFREFQSEAQIIYSWFQVLPNVQLDGKNFAINPVLTGANSKYTKLKLTGMEDTSVYFETDHSKSPQSEIIKIKMGNVVYPYNIKEVRNLDRFGGAVGTAERMVKYLTYNGRLNANAYPLVLEVGMGDVDIAPSREALSLSNTTELTIINAMVKFTDMFFDQIQRTIDTAPTTYEKYQALFAVPAIGGREFTVDGKKVNPHDQSAIWTFGNTQALAGRTNFLRAFSSDKFVVKYRRPSTRGIIPLNTSFDMTMYGPGLKTRNVILVDKAYKGELRLWVNANTVPDSAVVVVFGRDVKGMPIPLTDAEMAPFLEDKHPQVIKFSELKHQPVITPRTSQSATIKVTDDSMLIMGRLSSYNFFTQGNATQSTLSSVKPYDPAKPEIKTVYVCYQRISGKVYGQLQTEKDHTLVEDVEISPWSRAQGTSGSWSYQCGHIADLFNDFIPNAINHGQKLTLEHNGKSHPVAHVKHVLLNKEGYAAVIDNPDFPMFLTLDQAIDRLIVPIVPAEAHLYKVEDTSMYGRSNRTLDNLCPMADLGVYCKWLANLETKVNDTKNNLIADYQNHPWIKTRGYAPKVITKGTVTHTYRFGENEFFHALDKAAKDGIKGATHLRTILKGGNSSLRELFNYYRSESIQRAWQVATNIVLKTAEYNGTEMSNYLIDYAETHHKKS